MLRCIIFAPLAGAAINWLFGRRIRNEAVIGLIACGAIAVSTVFAFYLAFMPNGALTAPAAPGVAPVMDHIWTWLNVGGFRADFSLGMDRLSGIYVLFVTFVGL